MKKLTLMLSFLLLLIGLCSCGNNGIFCSHEYTEEVKPATCLEAGKKTRTCTICGKVKETSIARKSHEFSAWKETVKAGCESDGERTRTCSLCETVETEKLEKTGHDFGEFITVVESSAIQNGLEERTCENCGLVEGKIIQSINYVDTSLFLFDFDADKTYEVSGESELFKICDAAVYNRAEKVKFSLGFECSDLNSLVDRLIETTKIPFPFGIRASLVGKELTFTLSFDPEPTKKTESDAPYIQKASANYRPIEPSRAEDYDGFKINESVVSYKVSTTEQLYYALECRVKPLPVEGSTAERVYGKIKDVLRQIIDDEMNNFQKARAIYDWLIMNVTYDGELYDLLTEGIEIDSTEYKGFYLEGVFDDGIAVCDGISKAFSAMANVEGIPCVQVSGKQASNPGGVGHAWNKIYVGGNWYIVDATSGGIIVNKQYEVYSLNYFLMTDEEMAVRYTAVDHTDLICDSVYEPYKDTKLSYLGNEYDLYVESQAELNVVLKYFSEFSAEGVSIQFEIADSFNVGGSPMDEISEAAFLSGVTLSSSLSDGNIITVW